MQCCDTHMMLHCFDINMMIHFVIIFVVDEKTINWNTPWILSKLYIFVSLSDHYTNVFQIVYWGKEWYKRVTFVSTFYYAYVFLYTKLTFPPQKKVSYYSNSNYQFQLWLSQYYLNIVKISPIPLHQIPEFWWKSKNLKSGIKCRHFKMQLVEGINKCQHDGFLWIIARNMISRLCKVKMTRIKEVSSTCYHLIFNTIKFCEINEKIKYPLKAI